MWFIFVYLRRIYHIDERLLVQIFAQDACLREDLNQMLRKAPGGPPRSGGVLVLAFLLRARTGLMAT